MTDLEDKILKKNIPGKYTWWDKDSDEENSLHDSDDDDYNKDSTTDMQKVQKWEEKEIPKPLQMAMLNNLRTEQRGAKHTGVKGVMEDYKQAKKQAELDYEIECQYREAVIESITQGNALLPGETSISAASQNAVSAARVRRDQADYGNGMAKESDDIAEDDEFLRSYRDARLNQLRHAVTYPTYGQLREVDAFEYAELVDSIDQRSYLVVHMYEPYVPACKRINNMLEELARRMTWAQVVRLHCFKANPNFDPIALPVIMLYRGGELVDNFVKVTDALPNDFKVDDLQWLLENAGVVNPESAEGQKDFVVHTGVEEDRETTGRNTNGVTVNRKVEVEEECDSDDEDLEELMQGFVIGAEGNVFGL
ncbi:hypothetical protein TrCOL_g6438 [Triparma columacea]|uniref:Phosducin domain-containing protein n=1 Tax=Triparma columacea TaxID=722753 RepID=A0A9W7FZW0_9STRA|nr:hypothetical protein TrCOL_g6438 [Triparma columacea]